MRASLCSTEDHILFQPIHLNETFEYNNENIIILSAVPVINFTIMNILLLFLSFVLFFLNVYLINVVLLFPFLKTYLKR